MAGDAVLEERILAADVRQELLALEVGDVTPAHEAFLQGKIGYLSIYEIVQETLSRMPSRTPRSVSDILEIDRESRIVARELATAGAAGTVTA